MAQKRMVKKVQEVQETKHWKTLFPHDLLGAHNLNEGEELVVTIKAIKIEKVTGTNGEESNLPVVHFSGKVPKMVLNKTNAKTIAKMHGNEYEAWVGKAVQIYATKTRAFGEMVDALRIRDKVPVIDLDVTDALKKLKGAKSLQELQTAFLGLPRDERSDTRVITEKDALKAKFSK